MSADAPKREAVVSTSVMLAYLNRDAVRSRHKKRKKCTLVVTIAGKPR